MIRQNAVAGPRRAASDARWWSDGECNAVAAVMGRVWSDWILAWCAGATEVAAGVRARRAWEVDDVKDGAWMAAGTAAGSVWIAHPGEHSGAAQRLVLGCKIPGGAQAPLGLSLVRRAHADLVAMLRAAGLIRGTGGPEIPDASVLRPWTGGMDVVCTMGDAAYLRLLLDADAASSVLARDGALPLKDGVAPAVALTPLLLAASALKVQLRVGLSPCEMDVGTLLDLRVGDVVRFPHGLDAPLHLHIGTSLACLAHLGLRGQHRAIELARAA